MKELISKEAIHRKIAETARHLDQEYKSLHIVAVLKGSFLLAADLLRALKIPATIDFVQCTSYEGTQRGELSIHGLDRLRCEHQDVLLIDDIFDSGATLSALHAALLLKKPRSLKSLVLLSKEAPRVTAYRPDYVLFSIENSFVIGYGLDFEERYRGLSGIYIYQ